MASGYKIALFSAALASLLAAALAFAVFAMPGELLRASLDGLGLATVPAGAPTRALVMVASAGFGFLLAWTVLRSCDRPYRVDAEAIDQGGQDWPSRAGIAARSAEPEPVFPDLDDPFAELARGAQRVDNALELTSEQITPGEIDTFSRIDLVAAVLASASPLVSEGASGLVQRLNAGLAESEWPLPPGATDEAEDRLRSVLRGLRTTSRGG